MVFGDSEMIPGHDRMFVMWPIFLKKTGGIGTTNAEK